MARPLLGFAALALSGCVVVPVPVPASGQPSGTYKALGTEPFWALEIGPREMVFTEANAPGVRIVQATPQPISGTAGEIYQTARINVNVAHGRCSDGMSDRVYPDKVQIRVDGRAFEGCGGEPIPPVQIAGTSWRVLAVNGRTVPTGDNFTMSFTDDRLSARFGCNSISGPYRSDGQSIVPGNLAMTRMACPEMSFEEAAGRILSQPLATDWQSGERLLLTTATGSILLSRSH